MPIFAKSNKHNNNPQPHQNPYPIRHRILPIAKPVTTEILQHFNQNPKHHQQHTNAKLRSTRISQHRQHSQSAKPNSMLRFVPPIEDV